jgi:hypothetical protein
MIYPTTRSSIRPPKNLNKNDQYGVGHSKTCTINRRESFLIDINNMPINARLHRIVNPKYHILPSFDCN